MSDDTTLSDLLSLNLHNFEDEVHGIVDKACKEMGMEKLLSDLESNWKDMKFDYEDHPSGIMLGSTHTCFAQILPRLQTHENERGADRDLGGEPGCDPEYDDQQVHRLLPHRDVCLAEDPGDGRCSHRKVRNP